MLCGCAWSGPSCDQRAGCSRQMAGPYSLWSISYIQSRCQMAGSQAVDQGCVAASWKPASIEQLRMLCIHACMLV